MIIGDKRAQVIKNIQRAAEYQNFHAKVEVDDPIADARTRRRMLDHYLDRRNKFHYKINNIIASKIVNTTITTIRRSTRIIGFDNIIGISGGAILTSNHFNPIDNVVIRVLTKKMNRKKLYVVSQETNLMLPGIFGFLVNYTDILPISKDHHYIRKHFEPLLESTLHAGELILIYPEQEMWFNYRKPRPLKPGPYHYAAKFGVPIISCFVQITDLTKLKSKGFHQVKYTLHVLKPIYPDPCKSLKQNRLEMCRQDYQQKKEAYEKAYHKPLDYHFEPTDIAGWIPPAL